MIKQRFRQSIKCGTGEANFILRENPGINFSKEIKRAALTNLAYDSQCEGDRAQYVAGLINLTNKKQDIVNTIVEALGSEQDDTYALDQLFELAAIFAKEGDKKARQAIYKRYHKQVFSDSDCCGQDAIVKLDGIEGLRHIAAIRGKIFVKDPKEFSDASDSWFVDYFQEENPTINVYEELEIASKHNPHIRKYLNAIMEHKCSRKKPSQRPRYNYEIVKANIENRKVVPAPPPRVKELTDEEIIRLADDFLEESDPIKQEKYLRIFASTRYPYDYHCILPIAKKPNSSKNRLVEFACESLQYFTAEDIRQFALEKLEKTNNPADYLYLLVANYQEGDYKLLKKIATKYRNEDVIHSLIWGYLAIYKANKMKECKEPLEILYERLNCGIHRYEMIEILHTNGALSERILREIEFDSYDATRELFQKIKEGQSI
jgi:hypothetical protein